MEHEIKNWENKLKTESTPVSELLLKLEAEHILLEKGFDKLRCASLLPFEPKPWQMESALKTLRDMQGSVLLADEVGLGKTIEAGLILKELLHRKLIQDVLILVPAPLVEQWKNEMEEKFQIKLFDMKEKGWQQEHLIIASIHTPSRSFEKQEQLRERVFDVVIVDEAHCLKNHNTDMYKFVYRLRRKNTILMSATPLQNSMDEIYNLINIIKPGYLKSRKIFKDDYVEDKFTPRNVNKLKNLLNQVMIRHRRTNTLTEFPRRILINEEIEPTSKEKEFYKQIFELAKMIHQKIDVKAIPLAVLITLLKENASSPEAALETIKKSIVAKLPEEEKEKYEALVAVGKSIGMTSKMKRTLELLKESKEQIVIFSEFHETIRVLEKQFKDNRISFATFSGKLNSKEKEERIQQFKRGEVQVFLSTEAGGQGLNLQFCHRMLHYDLPWNPMKMEQRIGRIHRFGQKKDIQIYTFPVVGTVEQYLLYILTSKINLFEMVVGELDTIMSYMLSGETSIDTTIGKIILEAEHPQEVEEKLRKIGDELLKAKNHFQSDVAHSSKILNWIGVETK